MGLFDRIKLQCLKVIEWMDDSSDTIVYRFPMPDRYAIMNKSQLIVRESQVAIFVQEGQIADIMKPGRYMLDNIKNIPILTKLMNWKYAFENPYTGEVYFVNTKQFADQKWGTTNPVMMRDKDFGMVRLKGFGNYAFRVKDAGVLLTELFGTNSDYKTDDITDKFKGMIISRLSKVIGESKLPALELAANYTLLSNATQKELTPDFEQYGMALTNFYIENISLPKEVEEMMDKRTSAGLMKDEIGTYTQMQASEAMREAARNEGGGLAGAGVGLAAGMGMGRMFMGAMPDPNAAAAGGGATTVVVCPSCGEKNSDTSKFCCKCGQKLSAGTVCAACGVSVPAGAKFCPGCGAKQELACPDCGTISPLGTAFCPNCGKKL